MGIHAHAHPVHEHMRAYMPVHADVPAPFIAHAHVYACAYARTCTCVCTCTMYTDMHMMYMCIHTMYIMYIVYAVCSFMYGPCICTRFDRSRLCLYRRQEDGDYRCEDANGGREDKGRREDEEDLEDLPGNGHACMPRGVGWGGSGPARVHMHGVHEHRLSIRLLKRIGSTCIGSAPPAAGLEQLRVRQRQDEEIDLCHALIGHHEVIDACGQGCELRRVEHFRLQTIEALDISPNPQGNIPG